MPGGLAFDSTQSYIAFGVVKFVGYSLAGLYLKTQYPDSKANFLVVGLTRTLIGMMFGAAVGIIGFWALNLAFYVFLLGLIPVRILEWLLLLRIFFHRQADDKPKLLKNAALGVLWSFILDIPAIFGFIVTGGFWIC
jgi:hypothetical protein